MNIRAILSDICAATNLDEARSIAQDALYSLDKHPAMQNYGVVPGSSIMMMPDYKSALAAAKKQCETAPGFGFAVVAIERVFKGKVIVEEVVTDAGKA